MQCNNSISAKIWNSDRFSLTQPLHFSKSKNPWTFFLLLTFPRFHLLPHLVIDGGRAGWGLDHHAGHTTATLDQRQPRWSKKSEMRRKHCCSVLLYVVGLCTWRSKLWKIARWGRRRIHWQATYPTTKNWFSIQPEGFKTNLRLAFVISYLFSRICHSTFSAHGVNISLML